MPRGKMEEFTQAAFWSAIATATSGLGGFFDLLQQTPTQPKLLAISEVLIFGICVALAVVGALRPRDTETAEEYLNKLYNVPSPPYRTWKEWWGYKD